MPIKFRCSSCENVIKAPDEAAGKVVRCPKCKEKTKIPRPKSASSKATKRPKAKPGDSNAFLENINFDRMQDADVQLCQKCAAELPPEETACPECGFDPEQLTTAGRRRKKMADKGIDPKGFYENVGKESFAFAGRHIGQIMKTAWILTFFFICASVCGYFLSWVSTGPPIGFWTLLTFVSAMIPVGWLLVQHLEIIQLSMNKKDQIKKIRFDFAQCGMSGIKFFAWIVVYGLPFWIVFGGLGMLLDSSGVAIGLPLGIGLALFSILLVAPQGLSHLSMPVESPGWFFPKVAPTLRITFVPGLVWAILFLVANLPLIGAVTAGYYASGETLDAFAQAHQKNADIHNARVRIELAEDTGKDEVKQAADEEFSALAAEEKVDENLASLAIPFSLGVLCCFLLSFSSVVTARANGLFTMYLKKALNLIGAKKELKYEKKTEDQKIRNRKTTLPAPPMVRFLAFVIDILVMSLLNGFVGGFIYYLVGAFTDPSSYPAYIFIVVTAVAAILPTLAIGFYFVNNENGIEQTTPGKQALNLFVSVDENCLPITLGQAILRYVSFIFLSSGLLGGLGSLLALFRADRRTLHDLVSGTEVRMDKPKPKKGSPEADTAS